MFIREVRCVNKYGHYNLMRAEIVSKPGTMGTGTQYRVMTTHSQSQVMLPRGNLRGRWREKRISRQREQGRKARRISHVSRG